MEYHPAYWVAHLYLAIARVLAGDRANAISSARQVAQLGDTPWKLAGLGFVYARTGVEKEAAAVLTKTDDEGRRHPIAAAYYAAVVHAGLGNKEESLRPW